MASWTYLAYLVSQPLVIGSPYCHWKTLENTQKIGLKRPLYVGFTQCFFKTSPWTKTAWESVCHGMPIGIQHPPFDRWGDQFYRLCPCQWLGRTKRMCTNLSQIITANLTEFFFRSEKKNIWMIHSLSRSSGSKTHFFLSLILGISWHEKSLKIFASPWPIQNHRACRSGPMAAVPGSTRSLEMVVKPAKWSSSTAWRQDPIHGDTITRKHQKPGLNNQKLPDSSWFIHFGGDRLNG